MAGSHAPVVFTSSMHARRLLVEEFGCKPERVKSLPDCVNAELFKPAEDFDPAELAALRRSLGIPPERKFIVYLGLLAEYQGIGLLLEAMSRILARRQDAHLLLMGFPSVAILPAAGHPTGRRGVLSLLPAKSLMSRPQRTSLWAMWRSLPS